MARGQWLAPGYPVLTFSPECGGEGIKLYSQSSHTHSLSTKHVGQGCVASGHEGVRIRAINAR